MELLRDFVVNRWRICQKSKVPYEEQILEDNHDSRLRTMFEAFIDIAQSGREDVQAVMKAIIENVEGLVSRPKVVETSVTMTSISRFGEQISGLIQIPNLEKVQTKGCSQGGYPYRNRIVLIYD